MSSFQDWSTPPEYGILFRQAQPPGPEALASLNPIEVDRREEGAWSARIESAKGCEVRIFCNPSQPLNMEFQVRFSPGLSDEEREKLNASRNCWHLRIDPGPGPVLRTRKQSLIALGKILKTIRVGTGVYCVDSNRVWSLAMLADELMTKAALDIDALYVTHAVRNENGTIWVHTHGLAELGGFDIDLINPSQDGLDMINMLIRSLAFSIVEGALVIDEPEFQIAYPNGRIRMVPAGEFDASVDRRFAGVREADPDHIENRAVVCEPKRKKGLMGLGKPRVEPCRFLQRPIADNTIFALSKTATQIMANRAKETYPLLVELMGEFDSLQLPVLAKVACRTDSGNSHEHIWFEVHSADVNGIDATCINQPYEVSGLKQGDRGRYGFGQLTEWQMQTPIGSISPGQLGPIRHIRENRAAIEETMRQLRAENSG